MFPLQVSSLCREEHDYCVGAVVIKSSVFNSRGETESQVEILREFLEYTGKTKDSVVLWARHLGKLAYSFKV